MAPGDGSMASVVAVREADLVALPPDADPVAVAAAGLSAVAAFAALTWRGRLRAGETVLVLGGGGVVGQAAIQFAKAAGAARVLAAARSAAARDRARDAGADVVIPLDFGGGPVAWGAGLPGPGTIDAVAGGAPDGGVAWAPDPPRPDTIDAVVADGPVAEAEVLADRFRAACPEGADLVLDTLFGPPAAAAAQVLKPGGRLVNLGSSAAETAPFDSATLRSKQLDVLGYTNVALSPDQRADAIRTVADAVRAGRLTIAHETYPLADAAEAWSRQASGAAEGRVVLVP
ncbi:zinc-binding dehydrogenase [Cryptosporangium phraense]|uniref:Zinc-binding dehydrogenase n=2 Tax=Cryptosporangium phraense TaxID=2593070 RepID=A0A545AU58_9ACTN|nr:zinc-binding dehydrogenase [Cryptosporangium phraense]